MNNLIMALFILLVGCTVQAPVSEAPVYNVTVTDNSQYVIGDNNKAESRPDTTAKPVAKPDTTAQAKSARNGGWLFWLGALCGMAATVLSYLFYLKYFKKRA